MITLKKKKKRLNGLKSKPDIRRQAYVNHVDSELLNGALIFVIRNTSCYSFSQSVTKVKPSLLRIREISMKVSSANVQESR